jgi:hypothetical protein
MYWVDFLKLSIKISAGPGEDETEFWRNVEAVM